jgi:hypothetical protein
VPLKPNAGFVVLHISNFKNIMKTTKITITLLLLVSTLAVHAQNSIIKAGHMFDARSGKMLENQIIIIQDGKMKEVGVNLNCLKN